MSPIPTRRPPPDPPVGGPPPQTEAPSERPSVPAAPEETPADTHPRRWDTIKSSFRQAYERFISRFRGEAQPEEEKEYRGAWDEVAKNAAMGCLSVVGSYVGIKILADLPGWLYQKYWTNPAERRRITKAFQAKETELGEAMGPSEIEQKKARLEEAINASKFLTKEKKVELLQKLQDTVETYEREERALRTERNQKIAKLLDEAIQTRVKHTTLIKEALNSALMVAGLSIMRGVAYGAVAVYERHKKIVASEERRAHYFKEMVWKGFTETAHNLVGGGAETWSGKGLNAVKGATNVLRAAGFTELAISEYLQEGVISGAIEASLKAFEEKSGDDLTLSIDKVRSSLKSEEIAEADKTPALESREEAAAGVTSPAREEEGLETELPRTPRVLQGGTFKIITDESGKFVSIDPGEGDPESRLQAALKELEETGHKDSAEAAFIREQLDGLRSTEVALEPAIPVGPVATDELEPAREAGVQTAQAGVEEEEMEPLKKFKGEAGKVKFVYDKDGGVQDAFIPAYTPRKADVESALAEWGLTRDQVEDHYIEKRGGWEPVLTQGKGQAVPLERDEAPYVGNIRGTSKLDYTARAETERLIDRIERLHRQEATLAEMRQIGLTRTPEYAYWQKETEEFRGFVENEIRRDFPKAKKNK